MPRSRPARCITDRGWRKRGGVGVGGCRCVALSSPEVQNAYNGGRRGGRAGVHTERIAAPQLGLCGVMHAAPRHACCAQTHQRSHRPVELSE